ncbi:hypothetical protein CKO44_13470 [Rubrivivax gelatinosus]|uniref:hypothetical protein n=1 Tax=Rubrivivax gelatinosus TaxID=28068 RepID=UPI0019036BB2|nr:hypothetical protein [Rubrivivax gelatinosus]MBK1614478.1 hypothetical protein [Rubrivivax gelatinosus]MBZ8142092.1 hypothetical protein [Rubrivivax gelatinosus]
MKMRWWVLGWIAAVAVGVSIAHWAAPDVVFVPAAAQPVDAAPAQPLQAAPPVQAAAARPSGI